MCVCSGIYTNFNVFIVQTWKLDLLVVTEMGNIRTNTERCQNKYKINC